MMVGLFINSLAARAASDDLVSKSMSLIASSIDLDHRSLHRTRNSIATMAAPANDAWISGPGFTQVTTLDALTANSDPSMKSITIHRVNEIPRNVSITWRDNRTVNGPLFPTTLGSNDDILSLFPGERACAAVLSMC